MSKKITEFTRANVRELMAEVKKALEPVAERYGLTLDRKGRSFYRDKVPVMFELLVTKEDENGVALDGKAQEFKRHASLMGMKASDLGREFTYAGKVYRITGMNRRAKKYPILAEDVRQGKSYKFPADFVREALKSAA